MSACLHGSHVRSVCTCICTYSLIHSTLSPPFPFHPGPNGTHSVGPTARTVSQSESFQFIAWRTYFPSVPRTRKRLCVMKDNGNLAELPPFIDYDVVYTHDNLSCATAMVLTKSEQVLEYRIKRRSGVSADPREYRLVITTDSCQGATPETSTLALTGKCALCFSVSCSLFYMYFLP